MAKEKRFIEKTRDAFETAGERLVEARDKTRETIEEHPFTSIIIAAAIGAVVGVATAEAIRMIRGRNRE
jgi:ElaB/YqjD/DUF883 family membrane-anchored ribosome-binding protein